MKILHIAVFTPRSTNPAQADGFTNLGHQVIKYDYRQRAKVLGLEKRNSELIQLCRIEKPDIILFSKCTQMHIDVIRECNKIGITVLWYMDREEYIDEELREKFGECNYIFCSCLRAVKEAKKQNPNSYRLQGGYDPKIHHPILVPKICEVCFVGSIYSSQRKMYRKAVPFSIKGGYGLQLSKIVSETKINLNFTPGDGVSNRVYKTLAARGFLLSTPWDTLSEEFEAGVDLDVFKTPEELKSKIGYYLGHKKEREQIAEHGFKTVQRYDNKNYAKRILERVKGGKSICNHLIKI